MKTNDFERGQKTGAEMEVVTIAINNVWGGRTKDGGHVASYEKIGYHAGSVEFIRGVLDAGCKIVKYFVGSDGKIQEHAVLDHTDLMAAIELVK